MSQRALFGASSALLVVERAGLFALATVWSGDRSIVGGVCISAVLALSFVARGAVTHAHRAQLEGSLFSEATAGVLRGDVLRGDEVELQRALMEGVDAEARARADVFPSLIGEGAAAALAIAWAAASWSHALSFSLVLSLAVALTIAIFAQRLAAREAEAAWRGYETLLRSASEALLGRVELVSAAREGAALGRIASAVQERRRTSRRSSLALALAGRAPMGLATIAALGASVLVDPHASLASSLLVASALPPFAGLALGSIALIRSRAARARIATLLLPAPLRSAGDAPPPKLSRVTYRNVSCQYGDAPPAVDEVTLTWDCARVLVLSGANGSGKSTLLRLAVGLVVPHAGDILLGDVNMATIDLSLWRARVAYLPQRPCLAPQATVREAIRFLEPEATDAAIFKAISRVELLGTLTAKRAHDPLGVCADDLSSGERQRVAIARMLVRDADVYLFDEPDQNLDRKGLSMIARVVAELSAHAAVAIAAHDPEVLAIEGHHVELADGRVASSTPTAARPSGT